MAGIYQLININYELVKKSFRPPKVCDISPGVIAQVINIANIDVPAIEQAIRTGAHWDAGAAVAAGNAAGKEVQVNT